MRALVSAFILALIAGTASAQSPEPLAGDWTLSAASDPTNVCDISLGQDSTDGGLTLHIPFGCYSRFEGVDDVTGWDRDPADGAVRLNDRRGRQLFRFEPSADGYASAEPAWRLQRRAADPRLALTPQQRMSGVWKMTGLGGRALCAFDLTSDPAGRSGTLRQRDDDCFAEWKSKGWTRWSLSGRELTLYGRRGQPVLAFDRSDPFTFQKRDHLAQSRGRATEILFFSRESD